MSAKAAESNKAKAPAKSEEKQEFFLPNKRVVVSATTAEEAAKNVSKEVKDGDVNR